MRKIFNNVFNGKTVLITGHTGFSGSWLSLWLNELGANVIGYGLEPYAENDNFVVTNLEDKITSIIGDIRDYEKLLNVFKEYKPEIAFHLAAQALVQLSYIEPKETYDINIGGTVNFFEAVRNTDSVKVAINITSDKCYENKEWIWGYRENDPMGGYDPYSSSKGCSELITSAYRRSFFNPQNFYPHKKAISSVRAGNIIGGGDWAKNRIIPDCIRALKKGEKIGIRNPKSTRPWQHVLEPLGGYLLLSSKMFEDGASYAGAWNFGPEHNSIFTVEEVVKKVIKYWGNGDWEDISNINEPHEAKLLSLDISKARNYLKWEPILNIDETIKFTVEWYKEDKIDYEFDVNQINEYVSIGERRNRSWLF
jgi:CDP-glucose 4,6-dehydratase